LLLIAPPYPNTYPAGQTRAGKPVAVVSMYISLPAAAVFPRKTCVIVPVEVNVRL
jgi:hypothetical protein